MSHRDEARVTLAGLRVTRNGREELWLWHQTLLRRRVVIPHDAGGRRLDVSQTLSPPQAATASKARRRAIRRGLQNGSIVFIEASVSAEKHPVRWVVTIASAGLVAILAVMVVRGAPQWWPPANGLDLAIALAGLLCVGCIGAFLTVILWTVWTDALADTRLVRWDWHRVAWESATGVARSALIGDITFHRTRAMSTVTRLGIRSGEVVVFDGSEADRTTVLQALRPDLIPPETQPRAQRPLNALRPLIRWYLIASAIAAALVLGIAHIGGVLTPGFALRVGVGLAMLPVFGVLAAMQGHIEQWRPRAAKRRRASRLSRDNLAERTSAGSYHPTRERTR